MSTQRSEHSGYLDYRGHRWLAVQFLKALPLSGMAGGVFGALCAAGIMLGNSANPFSSEGVLFIGVAGAMGAMVGLAASPLMLAITTSRDVKRGVGRVVGVTGVFAMLFGAWWREPEVGLCAWVIAIWYACSCLIWRGWNGSGAYVARPGHCVRCGYDLRGLSGGACPECGTQVAA